LGAGVTAFYMFRLVTLAFEGKARFDEHHIHPHEAPKTMTIPLVVLAILSVVGGFIGIPESLGGGDRFGRFLEPVFEAANSKLSLPYHDVSITEYLLMVVSVAIAVTAIIYARRIYLEKNDIARRASERFSGLYNLLLNKYYIDEVYSAAIVTPTVKGSDKLLWKGFDVGAIDGLINFSAKATDYASQLFKRVQSGVVQSYAVVFVAGILFIIGWLIVW
jgi:NADH-quinone oxidoreductase subunit L